MGCVLLVGLLAGLVVGWVVCCSGFGFFGGFDLGVVFVSGFVFTFLWGVCGCLCLFNLLY